jgi:hypothetical protein
MSLLNHVPWGSALPNTISTHCPRPRRSPIDSHALVWILLPGTAVLLFMACERTDEDDLRSPRPAATATAQLDTFDTISSRGGLLGATLTAAESPITLGGQTFPSMVYNGDPLPKRKGFFTPSNITQRLLTECQLKLIAK